MTLELQNRFWTNFFECIMKLDWYLLLNLISDFNYSIFEFQPAIADGTGIAAAVATNLLALEVVLWLVITKIIWNEFSNLNQNRSMEKYDIWWSENHFEIWNFIPSRHFHLCQRRSCAHGTQRMRPRTLFRKERRNLMPHNLSILERLLQMLARFSRFRSKF